MKIRILTIALTLACLFCVKTSKAEIKDTSTHLSISGYVDVYYAYYTDDSVGKGNYQRFPSVSPRSGSIGLNTFQINMQYDADKVRAMGVLHYGDIGQSAWSSTFNSIMEAHAGVKICDKLWLDAGFFRTHFGTEFLLPRENLMSSVTVNTFYEPYYESGFRLNYMPTKKLEIDLYIVNGYGIFIDNNSKKSLGTVITYALGDNGSIGYTNYIGDDAPDSSKKSHLRIHQNVYFNYQFGKLKTQVGGNFCIQQNSDTTGAKTAHMFSGLASMKYLFTAKKAAYVRGEIFNDPSGVMSGLIKDKSGMQTGYKLIGFTAGVEYKPTDKTYIRLEGRHLQNDKNQEIYRWDGKNTSSRDEVMLNFGVSF